MSDLAIPDFLRRTRTPGYKPKLHYRMRWTRNKPRRPEGQRWTNADLTLVYLYDEAPVIGCGYRHVWVSEGRKWCKLASTDGVSKTKIPMAVWAEIARREVA